MNYPDTYFLVALFGGIYLSAILLLIRMIYGKPGWLWVLAPGAIGWVLVSYPWVWAVLSWHRGLQNGWSDAALGALILLIIIAAGVGLFENRRSKSSHEI